jgi:hypothetical protein
MAKRAGATKSTDVREFERTVDVARLEFLKALSTVAPQVLSDLALDVYPTFQKWVSIEPSIRTASEDLEFLDDDLASPVKNARGDFRHAYGQWASKFDLRFKSNWFTECVLDTLHYWHDNNNCSGWNHESIRNRQIRWDSGKSLTFSYPPIEPRRDNPRDYRTRVLKDFEQRLDAHIKERCTHAPMGKTHKSYHYDWLVEYQVNRKNYVAICGLVPSADSVDPPTVSEAIRKTSANLQLILRKPKRGRS